MASTRDIVLENFQTGDTDKLRFTIRKNGVAWLDIDTVEVVFEKPDRVTQFSRDAVSEGDNVWSYTTAEDDIDVAGWWTLSVIITDNTVRRKYPYEISFLVTDNP